MLSLKKPHKEILLFSGGIDSYIAWHWLKKPQTLYFDIKGKYSAKEIKVIKKLVPSVIIDKSLDLSRIEQSDAHVPYRNLFFSLIASARYSDIIYIIGIKDDRMSDKTEKIFKTWSKMLSNMENRKIRILSPFWKKTKSQIIKWYLDKGLSKDNLLFTVSCYSKNENYCGKCASCFRKWVALQINGFNLPFYNKKLMIEYRNKCQKGIYNKERNKTTLEILKNYGTN